MKWERFPSGLVDQPAQLDGRVRPVRQRALVLYAPPVQAAKRLIDLLGATIVLALCWPVLVLIAVWIRLDSPGPALYVQRRVGRQGKPFRIWKFRTMCHPCGPLSAGERQDEEALEDRLRSDPRLREEWEAYQKVFLDPRVTRLGRFLRRYSLDELPQLWNVLRGEMSLVGPRPFFAEQQPAYGAAYSQYIRLRPGITGLWQVSGRNRASFAERVEWDEYYAQNWSVGLEISILLRTLWVVLSGEGAY